MRDRFPDFAGLIEASEDEAASPALRLAEATGRPLGASTWVSRLEVATGRLLSPQKRGPRPKTPFRGR